MFPVFWCSSDCSVTFNCTRRLPWVLCIHYFVPIIFVWSLFPGFRISYFAFTKVSFLISMVFLMLNVIHRFNETWCLSARSKQAQLSTGEICAKRNLSKNKLQRSLTIYCLENKLYVYLCHMGWLPLLWCQTKNLQKNIGWFGIKQTPLIQQVEQRLVNPTELVSMHLPV